jgi:hypothetical protein
MKDWADEEGRKTALKCHWNQDHDAIVIANALRAAFLRGHEAGRAGKATGYESEFHAVFAIAAGVLLLAFLVALYLGSRA